MRIFIFFVDLAQLLNIKSILTFLERGFSLFHSIHPLQLHEQKQGLPCRMETKQRVVLLYSI
jgi:hypothetical protein